LILRKGPGNNIGVVGPIVDSIQNSGSYHWNIPANLPAGLDYAVQIIIGPAANVANVGPDAYNFTPLLELKSNFTGPATNGTTASVTRSALSTVTSVTTSAPATETSSSGETADITPIATKTAAGGSGSTQTAGSTSTAKSSAAMRIEGLTMGGHGVFALIVALAIGIVASF
jgi:hypothetical protein